MSSLRQQVVAAARGWIGTPYHAHARVRGAGVDCIHLLCAVFEEVGLISPIDPGMYPISWLCTGRRSSTWQASMPGHAARTLRTLVTWPLGTGHVQPCGHRERRWGLVHSLARLGVIETPIDGAPLAGRPVIFYDLYSIRN